MPSGYAYLGKPGALQQLPSPAPGYSPTDTLGGGTHELAGGGFVRDRVASRRRFVLTWPAMSDANWSLVRTLARLPGPYRYLDPLEPNLLTVSQSTGTDELATTEGFSARVQGAVASDLTLARSGVRSLRWDSTTTLSATGRGVNLATSTGTIDKTWTAVRPSVAYSFAVYARASAAVTMQAGIAWYSSAGALISTDTGTGVSLPTGNWNTRLLCENKTAPSTAAYAIPLVQDSVAPAATVSVYLDDASLNEGAAALAWTLGAGTPIVSVDSLAHSIVIADGTAGTALHEVELTLLQVG